MTNSRKNEAGPQRAAAAAQEGSIQTSLRVSENAAWRIHAGRLSARDLGGRRVRIRSRPGPFRIAALTLEEAVSRALEAKKSSWRRPKIRVLERACLPVTEPLERALLDAGIIRLRPVLITVSATLIALVPLAMHGGPLWEPVCLLLVPDIYAIFVRDLKLVKWEKS